MLVIVNNICKRELKKYILILLIRTRCINCLLIKSSRTKLTKIPTKFYCLTIHLK